MKKILSFEEWWDQSNYGWVTNPHAKDLARDAWNYRNGEVSYWIEKHADNVAKQMGVDDDL